MGTVVGVLRGGPSDEHEVSLKSGHSILSNLNSGRYTLRDIYIDKKGQWHERGKPIAPEHLLRGVDVVLIALHGAYGEDGQVQKFLERFGVPYAGSDSFGSFLAMHKLLSKEKMRDAGLVVPRYVFIETPEDADTAVRDIIRRFPQPVVVKPVAGGSSIGVSMAGGYAPVYSAIKELFDGGSSGVLVEERILGREATAGVVEGLRDEKIYALPAIEIIPPEGNFFSYSSKYSGATREVVPAQFTKRIADELARQARLAHETLGLRDYSHSDFIVSPKGIYYLETNALPGLTTESLLPKSLAAIGIPFSDFLDHLVNLALSR